MANPNPSYKFPVGLSGNPGGKPVNARNKLNATFLKELSADFNEHGKAAIVRCREEQPGTYIKVLAALQPKEVDIRRPMDDLSDEALEAAYVAAKAIIEAQKNGTVPRTISEHIETGTGSQEQTQPVEVL
jgi:histidinol dehydrogenase